MKIAVNSCYGGFSVSKEVADKLKVKGYDIGEGYAHIFSRPNGKEFTSYSYHLNNEMFKIESDNWDKCRTHPDLIEAIESSESPSGALANVRIVDIPDDVDWELDEYDGIETVREKSRSW